MELKTAGKMRETWAIILIIVIFMDYANSQYPDCADVTCPDGTIPLSPLSYNTVRPNVFNGTQPSNEGCTNGTIVSERVMIDCEQGTTLIDCDQGYNDNVDYSDLSSYFIWSGTESVAAQVSIVFSFLQIRISRITMSFWSSQTKNITVPRVKMFTSDYFDGSIVLSNEIKVTTNSLNRTVDGRHRLNVYSNMDRQFQYLRIEMNFNDNSEWIFLSEVQFCGNAAPFRITQPPIDNDALIISPIATMATLTCSLNITIPFGMFVTWDHNGNIATTASNKNAIQTSHSTTLLIENPQSSDAGLYRCTFNNAVNDGWVLRRHIRLLITIPNIIYPPTDSQVIIYSNSMSSVQLMCSLNITIPSSVTVIWLHNGTIIMTPPNEVLTAGNTTMLVVRNPQPSDAGVYQCVFNGSAVGWMLSRDISVTAVTAAVTTTSISTDNNIIVISTIATTTATIKTDAIYVSPAIITSTNIITTSVSTSSVMFTTPTNESSSIITTTIPSSPITNSSIPSSTTTPSSTIGNSSIPSTTITPSSTITDGSTPSSSTDSQSGSVGAIVAGVIVVILLVAVIVTLLVIAFIWRRNKKNYNSFNENSKIPPLSVTGLSILDKDEPTASDNQKPNLELESRSVIDPNYRPGSSPEMLMQSQEQSMSLINPNYQETKRSESPAACGLPEFNPANPRDSVASGDNQVFTESINTPAFLSGKLQDSKCDDTPTPCTSIYADPLPLVKTKGPPVVSFDNMKEIRELGTGLFGTVILANTVGLSDQYLGIGYSNDTTMSKRVAVKLLKSSASAEVKKAFDKEIKFMSRLKDDNVIRLLGICTTGTPFIMMEYMENGDLNGYLRQKKFSNDSEKPPVANEVTLIALVHISHQIASGMKYLSSCKFIHRDLASRNILVGVDNVIKIADFGMSQNLYSAYYCRVGGRSVLPIRWMAYECFFGKFSVQTDVWAFGITLWEVFTLCRHLPYDDLTNQQMVEDAIKGAKRKIPSQPENCPDDIYCIIKSCLQHDPSKRADFKALCDQLYQYYTNLL